VAKPVERFVVSSFRKFLPNARLQLDVLDSVCQGRKPGHGRSFASLLQGAYFHRSFATVPQYPCRGTWSLTHPRRLTPPLRRILLQPTQQILEEFIHSTFIVVFVMHIVVKLEVANR
jgi:hypothetical protein